MINPRKYGNEPYTIAVIHGGPGAGGEMAPIAIKLSSKYGVLEPIQTALSITGQIKELKAILELNGDTPCVLIGHSWGAWLSVLLSSKHPILVEKLILIGSGPFEPQYAENIQQTRMNRLNKEERIKYDTLLMKLSDSSFKDKDAAMKRLGKLVSKTDNFDLVDHKTESQNLIKTSGDIFQNVWNEAAEMRKSGYLLEQVKSIDCPVFAIHGDYDPHPSEGVQKPLSINLEHFEFHLIENCGHNPWVEKQAQEKFFALLNDAIEQKKPKQDSRT